MICSYIIIIIIKSMISESFVPYRRTALHQEQQTLENIYQNILKIYEAVWDTYCTYTVRYDPSPMAMVWGTKL